MSWTSPGEKGGFCAYLVEQRVQLRFTIERVLERMKPYVPSSTSRQRDEQGEQTVLQATRYDSTHLPRQPDQPRISIQPRIRCPRILFIRRGVGSGFGNGWETGWESTIAIAILIIVVFLFYL